MKIARLEQFVRGWICGQFIPSILQTNCELGIKIYKSGDKEARHIHKLANEITIVIDGSIKMNDIVYNKYDIILIEKNESTDFEALTDCITCVFKDESIVGDKHSDK